ncbi:MAG: helix-turn-helix transcriptional regulator [Clostridia bacterium]|nr:helix-turn-helix transcriptional regulator [Clostridia bacterium]
MFFEKDILAFNILDVIELKQKNISMFNSGRNYNALSFRSRADTLLRTEKEEHHVGTNYVSFVPARLDYSRISSIDELIVVHFDTTSRISRSIECFEAKDPETMSDLFSEMIALWNRKDTGYKYRCSALLYEILAECHAQNFKAEARDPRIAASVEYMMKNYRDAELTVGQLAERSYMSEVYFRKLFKKVYGVSPRKYIIDLRIQHATGLISAGYYSLEEVAFMSGYNDYKYFSVEFKKALGVSPSKYLYNFKK